MSPRTINYTFAAICLITLAFSLSLLNPLQIAVKPGPLLGFGALVLFLLVLTAIYARRDRRIAQVSRVAFWSIVFTNVFVLPIYLGIRLETPFHDNLLAAADRSLGLEVPRVLGWLKGLPVLAGALEAIYDSLLFLLLSALLLPAVLGQRDKSNELLLAVALSSLATLLILPFIQAVGPWVHYSQVHPTILQENATRMLYALKAGQPVTFDRSRVEPLVAFPSWHTILAVLSALALGRVSGVRWLAAFWAAAVVLSTVTTGWHYLVDVLGGLAVAAGAAWGARVLVRSRERAGAGQLCQGYFSPAPAPEVGRESMAVLLTQGEKPR